METAALLAPVTSLEFVRDEFLLTGEGPVLSVYTLHPRPKALTSLSILQRHRIHGIRTRSQAALPANSSPAAAGHREEGHAISCTTEPICYDVAVFGGKAVRLLRLHRDPQIGEHIHLELLGPLMELQDWALDVRWLSGDHQSQLCVAVAHNSALLLDVSQGQAVIQRSCQEGCLLYSALLLTHDFWSDTVLVGGTVFNQLVLWKPGEGNSSRANVKAPVERRLLGHSGVIFSISYILERGYLASASDDRSVRVWGVGALGGPGGKCGDLNPACLQVLYGHQARVFSVHLSPGKVFSAGEDGACLVWDWARDGKVVHALKGHRAGGVRALAVSEGEGGEGKWVATGGADGGVRLWRVEGEEKDESMEEAVTERLTDLKFPGDGLPKVVRIAGEEDENMSWSQIKFVVCTDKGLVYQYSHGMWEVVWQGPPEFQSYCVMETVTVTVKQSVAKACLCAVGNISGSLQLFPTSHPHCGIHLSAGSGKIHSLIWQKAESGVYLLASGAEGLVYRWFVEVNFSREGSIVLGVNPLPCFLLPPCAKRWLTAAVRLRSRSQPVLWVCGDRRGSLIMFPDREQTKQNEVHEEGMSEVLLRDRKQPAHEEGGTAQDDICADVKQGTMDTRENPDGVLEPLSCLFGVHGKQGVTSVCEYRGLLYSTGRDGCVRVFRVQSAKHAETGRISAGQSAENKERLQLEVLRVQRACRGMEWLERILILRSEISEEELGEESEHGFLEGEKDELGFNRVKGREARFVIVGFHAVHFVVWDPVKQERLLAVPCGGGHRSWSLWPSYKGVWPGYGALVFIKQGSVLASEPPREGAGKSGGWGLREGVHGRGIGCVCRLGRIVDAENDGGKVGREERQWEIVVMGGEDTSLSVLAVNPITGSIKVLSVITDHISSVRTMTAITSPDAGRGRQLRSLSALLLSAGGRAQIQCYRLLLAWDRQRAAPSCQVIQVASHRLDAEWERRRNRHKTVKMDPETRYMSITVVDEKTDGVLVALSCSDGAIRLLSVSEGKRQIDLLWETFHHQRCVLSVATCNLEDDKGSRYKLLFSAATDGKVALWHLTEALLSSSDNASGAATRPMPCLEIPAHQSGVNSLAVWAENPGQQECGCLVTVASGGDDGQLTVSTVRVQYPDGAKIGGSRGFPQTSESPALPGPQFQHTDQLRLSLRSQAHVELAHAAPLTALKLLSPGLLVSTSSDQRVCLWKVSSDRVSHSGALCSHVADAAGLAVWEGGGGENMARRGVEAEGETAGGISSQETADEVKGGESTEAGRETGDLVWSIDDEKRAEVNTRGIHLAKSSPSAAMKCQKGNRPCILLTT
ncbi:tRNA (34-2'-O)-methyltransferase regulator WDR6 isoform X2 [Salarias fasciatus]|uniref:tRNA (34-2'-O)-methyltransferase regulator WDR6 isoform X2 n=1 Tax=Salarias fasciatus TaxID=181472 RepID=UPI001176CFA6|nr:WD repeat-containing protein 6 isoform X2 [Salarias fasciatus]XP_029974318.1 WD repeat-containing protein 6 isoform X2 [Salarias fasciatus]